MTILLTTISLYLSFRRLYLTVVFWNILYYSFDIVYVLSNTLDA